MEKIDHKMKITLILKNFPKPEAKEHLNELLSLK
jgi:hypothetical protein